MLNRYPKIVALGAGLTATLGFQPLNLVPLMLFGFALLIELVNSAPNWRSALLRGWLFGAAHFTLGLNWIARAFQFQADMPAEYGYAAVFLLSLYLAVFPALATLGAWLLARGRPLALVAAMAGCWIIGEWLRSWVFTGFPWNPVSAVLLPVELAGGARYVGAYALSGLVVAASGAVWLAARRERRSAAIAGAASLGLLLLGAIDPFPAGKPAPDAPLVRIVQPNVGAEFNRTPEYPQMMYDHLSRQTKGTTGRPRLILWPEGAFPLRLEDGYPPRYYYGSSGIANRRLIANLMNPGDVLLTGNNALNFDDRGELVSAENSVIALDAGAAIIGKYDKAHLVPYGEYLPLKSVLSAIGLRRVVDGNFDFEEGPGPANIEVPGVGPIGVQICYEIIFSGRVADPGNRPRAIFNPSYDAWYGSWGPPQHLAQARLRAIEEGLPVLRATTTGVSAVIDAEGGLVESLALDTEGHIETPLPPARPATPFARFGQLLTLLVAGLLLAIAVATRRRER